MYELHIFKLLTVIILYSYEIKVKTWFRLEMYH